MILRRAGVVSLLAVALAAQGGVRPSIQAKITLKALFAGEDGGENVCTWNDDGTFESKTTLDIAGQKVNSVLTGKQRNGKIIEYSLEETRNGKGGKVVVKDGMITAFTDGKQVANPPFTSKAPAFMGNLHPQTLRTVLSLVKPSDIAGGQKIKACFLDNTSDLELTVSKMAVRKAKQNGVERPIYPYMVKLAALDIEYVLSPEGGVIGMGVPVQSLQFVASDWTDIFVDPVAKYKELSQPTFKVKLERHVETPMRDGVKLYADVHRPDAEGKFPAVLSRTPYGRAQNEMQASWYAKRGYVFVSQDVRGREDSEGNWEPFQSERKDGFDTIDWISKQPWSDGKVGMIGGSYVGMVQWAAAVEQHPALKCIVPQVSPPDAFFNLPYDHGVPMLFSSLWWLRIVNDKKTNMASAATPMEHPEKFTTLPLTELDNAVIGTNFPIWDSWMKRETPKQYPGFDWLPEISKVKIPALNISGWFDGDGIGTKLNYAQARKGGNVNQWLIYGPWSHAFNTTSRMGKTDFGSQAILELDSFYLRWFDTWLKGKDVNLKSTPKVQVFVTGKNEWRSLNNWPDTRSKKMTYFLTSTGSVAGATSKGALSTSLKSSKAGTYSYDPSKDEMPKELLKISAATEPDLTVKLPKNKNYAWFKSEPVKADLEIGGPLELNLFFSTSAKDTDFFANLFDIGPDGTMVAIGIGGKIRARYLAGWNTPALLTPGKTYNAKIALWDVAHCFKPGHRLGLLITSSAFPMYARNLGTGEPNATGTKMVVQNQTIFMDPKRPSSLSFMVLPKK